MKISHYAVKHPVVIAMILIALIAFGIYCVLGINTEFIPDISLPRVEVITVYPGASAEDVEDDVTGILENDFVTLPNFKSMNSQSAKSVSWISVTYMDGVDVYEQLTEIRYRIDSLVDDLPTDAQRPYVLVGGATMLPIMQFAVFGGEDTARISQYINDVLKPQITRIDGVAEVSMYGDRSAQIEVKLRLDDIQSKGVSVLQVYQVLEASNFSIPLGSGEFQGRSINIKYDGETDSLSELEALPVGMGTDNVMIRLRDVADVSYTYPKEEQFVMSEGSNLIMVQVTKMASGNTVKISNSIKKILETVNADTGGALDCRVYSDDSKMIDHSLNNVLSSGILGVIIAVIVIWLFLSDGRATLVIGSSIPLCILFSFILMKVLGYTINLMTTSSFVVALGMVVDGSIVVLEQVSRYLGKKGFSAEDAIIKGSDEVGSSILASVLTTVVVFIPIVFLNGMVGMILNGFAAVLILCMFASLLVSIVVIPFLIKLLMGKERHTRKKSSAFLRGYEKFEGLYAKAIRWSLINRRFVIIVPTILLVLSFVLVSGLGYSFIPSVDTGEFYVSLEFPNGYSVEQTQQKAFLAEEIIRSEMPEAEGVAVFVGMSDAMGENFSAHPNKAYLYVKLQGERKRSVHELILLTQDALSSKIPDVTVTTTNGGFDRLVGYISGGGGYQVVLVGTDFDKLYSSALGIKNFLSTDPEVTSVSLDTKLDEKMLTLQMDQTSLSSLGITSYEAGMVSAIIFNGVDTGRLTSEDGERSPIHLTSDIAERPVDEGILSRITISTLSGSTVSFADLGSVSMAQEVSKLHHTGRSTSISVSATLVSEDTSGVNQRMNAYLLQNPLPAGIEKEDGGIMGLIMDSLGNVVAACIIAVFLVYMVMVLQFERFKQPFVILLSIPFCFIGVVVCLLVFGSSLTLMSAVALISLAGIVVNNAIILVDYINQIRDRKRTAFLLKVEEDVVDMPGSGITHEEGRGKLLDLKTEERILATSIVQGGSSRLRPILMTTLTTIFGVVPMALAVGEGAELYASVGQTIAGGLLTSTLITLFIIPVVYFNFEIRELKKKIQKDGEKNEI